MEWYKEKEAPMYERWYDGSLGGDLLFRARAQCMDVNERNYRWSESRSKVCQMCNIGEDELVEHVVLECEKYERDRMEMMQVILTELGHSWDERVKMTGREWTHFAPNSILKCLYYAHIYPYLIYCNPTWSQTYPCHLYINVLHRKVNTPHPHFLNNKIIIS